MKTPQQWMDEHGSLVQLISKQRRERAAEAARDAAESIAEAFNED